MGGLERPCPPGFQRLELNYTAFELRDWLEKAEYVSRGTYGNVCKAWDGRRGVEVAVKKLSEPFRSGDTARKAYRELRLLQTLEHENIIQLLDLYTTDPEPAALNNIYISTLHAGWDLQKVLREARLTDAHERFIIYQLLRGLKYLHSAGIVHRDLKPTNLCLTADTDLTILDLGLARAVTTDIMTEYIVTRYYRAPELVCWSAPYQPVSDMWSVGCILAELFRKGEPLFPGKESHHQFKLITDICGSPDEAFLEKVERLGSRDTRQFLERDMTRQPRQNFRLLFPNAPEEGVDFLERILVLDPERRMSVQEALEHRYLCEHHDAEDEPEVAEPIPIHDESPSKDDVLGWRHKLWTEIQSYAASHPIPPPPT